MKMSSLRSQRIFGKFKQSISSSKRTRTTTDYRPNYRIIYYYIYFIFLVNNACRAIGFARDLRSTKTVYIYIYFSPSLVECVCLCVVFNLYRQSKLKFTRSLLRIKGEIMTKIAKKKERERE